jgi:ABC-type transport system involved in multi-copper enzyme maturation permease subunit
LGTVGTSVFFAALTTVLILTHITRTPAVVNHVAGDRHGVYIGLVQASNGLVYGLTQSVTLLGLIAIIACAFAIASEYSYGTLRNLMVRQPRRLTLLGGSYLALMILVVLAAVLATAAAIAASYIMAPGQGIATGAWSAIPALKVLGEVTLAVIGYGTFGAALAVLLRSPVAAIGVAIGWSVAVENILSATISGADRWLPGKLLAAIAAHGTGDISFAHALIFGGAYTLIVAVCAAVAFSRRDVAS